MSDSQSENVMADVYLGIAIAGANTLVVIGVAIAFILISRSLTMARNHRPIRGEASCPKLAER